MSDKPTAIIIGAGPAGLTAALELLERADHRVVVFEAADGVGGISRTHVHNGNRIDLGGHRFFSKSDRVMDWWRRILPIEEAADVTYHGKTRAVEADGDAAGAEDVMLVRNRVSRIYFRGQFFDYPLSLSAATIKKLGLATMAVAGFSYIKARLLPVRPERTLEDFIVNRFGRHLYSIFFRDYTEKVWGVPCEKIPADWGAQRIKGVSITAVIKHALKKAFGGRDGSVSQKDTQTSLIERFLYPRFGPGHMWERVTDLVREKGGEVRFGRRVAGLEADGGTIVAALVEDTATGETSRIEGDVFFSTMPVRPLVRSLSPEAPAHVREVADGLMYRDFMTVGLLLKRLALNGGVKADELAEKLPDNWIYVQEPGVKVGRIQVFNNWSPYLVKDPDTIWIGLEYFVDDTEEFWTQPDQATKDFAIREMTNMGFIDPADVLDSVVLRQRKAYPAYFGTYDRFSEVRDFLKGFANLYPLGRNGQHRYNNQDHSMLTAMVAVDGLSQGRNPIDAVWDVNTEEEYHEEK